MIFRNFIGHNCICSAIPCFSFSTQDLGEHLHERDGLAKVTFLFAFRRRFFSRNSGVAAAAAEEEDEDEEAAAPAKAATGAFLAARVPIVANTGSTPAAAAALDCGARVPAIPPSNPCGPGGVLYAELTGNAKITCNTRDKKWKHTCKHGHGKSYRVSLSCHSCDEIHFYF